MCTLTIIPLGEAEPRGARIACNRDESRERPEAQPPEMRTVGERRLVMPVDPQAGGTWIGASDAGLVAVLLNAYPAAGENAAVAAPSGPLVSRGTIIPQVLACPTFDAALECALGIDSGLFAPFRLVLASRSEVAECAWGAGHPQMRSRAALVGPLMFTSSGLGDERVEHPRRALFRQWFREPAAWPREQDAFHRHRWPDRPEVSVCMSRAEAHTVSYTVVELSSGAVLMHYFPSPPDQPSTARTIRLPVTGPPLSAAPPIGNAPQTGS